MQAQAGGEADQTCGLCSTCRNPEIEYDQQSYEVTAEGKRQQKD